MKRIAFLVSDKGWLFEELTRACERGLLNGQVCLLISNKSNAICMSKAQTFNISSHYVSTFKRTSTEYSDEILTLFRSYRVDLAVTMFNRILTGDILNIYKNRCINLHLSLLPAFPGVSPRKRALEHGVRFTGATIHFIDENIDAGPIIAQAVFPISPSAGKNDLYCEYGKILPAFLFNALDYILRDAYSISCRKVILAGASYDSTRFSPSIQEKFSSIGVL